MTPLFIYFLNAGAIAHTFFFFPPLTAVILHFGCEPSLMTLTHSHWRFDGNAVHLLRETGANNTRRRGFSHLNRQIWGVEKSKTRHLWENRRYLVFNKQVNDIMNRLWKQCATGVTEHFKALPLARHWLIIISSLCIILCYNLSEWKVFIIKRSFNPKIFLSVFLFQVLLVKSGQGRRHPGRRV